MAALLASIRGRSPWWVPSTLLALATAVAGLLAGWPLSVSVGSAWALILVVALARSAGQGELRLFGVPLGRVLLWAAPVLVLGWEISTAGLRPGQWDPLFVTGVFAFVIAVEMADSVPDRLAAAYGRLKARGVLEMTEEAWQRFNQRSEERARKWTLVGGPVVAVIILVAWIAVLGPRWPARFVLTDPAMLFECLCGWIFIPLVHEYESWRSPYLGLLLAAIVIELMTFILPMLSVHSLMREEKTQLLARADQLSGDIESLQQRLLQPASSPDRQQIKDSITDKTEQYQRIEQAPTWPVNSSIRRRFSLSNAALFLPFVGYAVGGTAFWQQLSNSLQNLGH